METPIELLGFRPGRQPHRNLPHLFPQPRIAASGDPSIEKVTIEHQSGPYLAPP